MKGSRLKLIWLKENFSTLCLNSDDETGRCYLRAYILLILGCVLFPDKSHNMVHLMFLRLLDDTDEIDIYSWGGACLAWMYRQLCIATNHEMHDITGSMPLLQVWAWERFAHIAPIRRHVIPTTGAPLATRWCVDFNITTSSTHVVSQYKTYFDRQKPS